MRRLFGTDGIHGIAGEELNRDLAVALGRAAVRMIGKRIFIGRDTRESGPVLEQALVDGIAMEGGQAAVVGIVPTPAVALVAREASADCGIMISAGHNSPEYNGFKLFDGKGCELSDALEDEIGLLVNEMRGEEAPQAALHHAPNIASYYANHAARVVMERGVSFNGIKVVVDCAHGAAYATTPATLRALGAEVISINADPDGSQINVGCGSTHLAPVIFAMQRKGADLALAHDGDGGRLVAVAPDGSVVDGDCILGSLLSGC